MSVVAAAEWDEEFRLKPRQGAETRPAPAWYDFNWDATKASTSDAWHDVPGRKDEQRRGELAAAAAELAQLNGRKATDYYIIPVGEPLDGAPMVDEAGFWRDLAALRRSNPGALGDLGKDRTDFDARLVGRLQAGAVDRRARMAKGGLLGNLAGGVVGAMSDPINLMTAPIGGGGRTVAAQILRSGLLNAGIETAESPLFMMERAAQGREMTLAEAGTNVALAGLGGAALTGIGKALPVAGRAVAAIDARGYAAAAPIRAKIDPVFAERDLARLMSQSVPAHALSPEQGAALHVLQRAIEVDDASPYVSTYEGLEAHGRAIDAAMANLVHPAAAPVPAPASAAVRGAPAPVGSSEGALRFILELEGGARLVTDSGGLTKYGISAKGNPGVDIANLTEAQALDIYRRKYLAGLPLAGRSADAALVALDAKINHRGGFAEMLLREAGDDPARMIALRRAEYARLIRENPAKYGRYEKGWENRLKQVEQRLGMEQGAQVPAGPFDALGDAPLLRPDALDAVRPLVTAAGRELPIAAFRPEDIGVDATLMQFKSGGDAFGVTERLRGVAEWDPMAAGMVTVWEAADGRRLIADGHQRLGLAQRMRSADPAQDITLNAFVLREADGFSASDARVLTALKNIGEGTGTATDAAKVFREVGLDGDAVTRRLPPKSALVRDGKALARLSDEAFGAVVNDVIPESHAAVIGHIADDPASHMALINLLATLDPPTRKQAEGIVRQALDAGFHSEKQEELFGTRDLVTAVYAQKARLLEKALGELRKLKGAFGVAARNADVLDAAGNRIDVGASEAEVAANVAALALVDRLALRKGNAVSAIFQAAAERLAKGEPIARVVRDVVGDVRKLDLASALDDAGSSGRIDGAFDPAGGSGRSGEPDAEAGRAPDGAADDLTPATRDELEAAGQGGFALFDEPSHRAFDDPDGDGVQAVADSVWHDVRAEVAQIEQGSFGPIFSDVDAKDWAAVVRRLSDEKTGEVQGALQHAAVGDIDLVWGKEGTGHHDGYGLSKILRWHPEVVDDLPRIVADMEVVTRSSNRINLESADHRAGIRLDWDGQEKTWLITAYALRAEASPAADGIRATGTVQAGNFPALEAGPDISQMRVESNAGADVFDLGDGKGARSIDDIEAELNADAAGIDAIKACLL